MNTYQKDENNEEVLLSTNNDQVMMEWEKPYMEASIDFLSPKGHVLEIGFGCGYSASQILKHPIKSYTIIECDPVVIEKANKWKENYTKVPIHIVEGTWQEKISTLQIFDEIYFDDFPLNINKESSQMDRVISMKRMNIFIDLCIQNHTRIGSKISFYLNHNEIPRFGSDTEPFVFMQLKKMNIEIPETCKYRNLKEQKCTIPVITKIKEYDFQEASNYALRSIQANLEKGNQENQEK